MKIVNNENIKNFNGEVEFIVNNKNGSVKHYNYNNL